MDENKEIEIDFKKIFEMIKQKLASAPSSAKSGPRD